MKSGMVLSKLIGAAIVLLILGCNKKDNSAGPDVKVPVVTTAEVSAIAQTTAQCGGTVTSDGGATVTARGVCWSTNQTPTVSDTKTTDGTGAGTFTSSITGLTKGTTYYVRAYATNSAGTGYGSAMSLTTLTADAILCVSLTSWSAPAERSMSPSISVTNCGNQTTFSYTVNKGYDWLSVSLTQGVSGTSFTITADTNKTGSERVGYVTVTATGISGSPDSIEVRQPSIPCGIISSISVGTTYEVAISNNYVYVTSLFTGLKIFLISNPTALTQVGSYQTPGYAQGVALSGAYAYLAEEFAGIQILNVSNPASPTLVGSYDTPDAAMDIAILGNFAYVADRFSGLQIINISNPEAPTLVSSYKTPGYAHGIAVVGNYAYIADSDSGLQIIDISNKVTPRLIGGYVGRCDMRDVVISGSYAYVADLCYGLLVIDISNPLTPMLRGSYDTPGYATYSIAVADNYAYIADEDAGLEVVNISNPGAPSLVRSYDTPGQAGGVAILGDYAYVADNWAGLQIIRICLQ